jgi:hypothetical protein
MSTHKTRIQFGPWRFFIVVDIANGTLQVEKTEHVNIVRKAGEYLLAETSRFTKSITLAQIEERSSICSSCDSINKKSEDEWYCKGCGCPEWTRSKLQTKWSMPAANCPLQKWKKIEEGDPAPANTDSSENSIR